MSQVHSHFLGNTEHHSFIRLRGESEVLSGIIDGRRSYRLVCVYVSVKSCVSRKGESPTVRCVDASDNSLSAASMVWLCVYMCVSECVNRASWARTVPL